MSSSLSSSAGHLHHHGISARFGHTHIPSNMADFGFSSSPSSSSGSGMDSAKRSELMDQVKSQLLVAQLQELLSVS